MEAKVFRADEVPWSAPPGHEGALSKYLVTPESVGSRHLDFRISCYQPGGFSEVHSHADAENIYYILRGTGQVELDGVRHGVEPHMTIFIPPGVSHGIFNTGLEDLLFLVAAAPASDMPR